MLSKLLKEENYLALQLMYYHSDTQQFFNADTGKSEELATIVYDKLNTLAVSSDISSIAAENILLEINALAACRSFGDSSNLAMAIEDLVLNAAKPSAAARYNPNFWRGVALVYSYHNPTDNVCKKPPNRLVQLLADYHASRQYAADSSGENPQPWRYPDMDWPSLLEQAGIDISSETTAANGYTTTTSSGTNTANGYTTTTSSPDVIPSVTHGYTTTTTTSDANTTAVNGYIATPTPGVIPAKAGIHLHPITTPGPLPDGLLAPALAKQKKQSKKPTSPKLLNNVQLYNNIQKHLTRYEFDKALSVFNQAPQAIVAYDTTQTLLKNISDFLTIYEVLNSMLLIS